MTFKCTFNRDTPVEVFERGSSRAALTLVAYDSEHDRSYSVLATLDGLPGGGEELAFSLVEYDGAFESEHTYWSGKDLPRLFSRADRELILAAVMRSILRLVETYQPTRIFLCTFDRNMPPRALTKHLRIVELLEGCGYVAEAQESYHGEKAWWLQRKK